jgi:hypothetical protein
LSNRIKVTDLEVVDADAENGQADFLFVELVTDDANDDHGEEERDEEEVRVVRAQGAVAIHAVVADVEVPPPAVRVPLAVG